MVRICYSNALLVLTTVLGLTSSALAFAPLHHQSVKHTNTIAQQGNNAALDRLYPRSRLYEAPPDAVLEDDIATISTTTDKNAATNSADSDTPFTVTSSNTGPAESLVHTLTFNSIVPSLRGDSNYTEQAIVIETGKIGRLAAGAVTLTRGDSVLYATASRDSNARDEIDFLPLSVEHQERFSSAGLTSGSYNKRDGRPAEHEILTCRLIDRPLRPLIDAGWRHETQLLSWVLSYDGERSCDPLAITASATALYLSEVPLHKPVAAVQVGMRVDGSYVINPTNEEMSVSRLHLTVAGTIDAVLMIEGAADFLSEEQMVQAVHFGHESIKVLCEGIAAFGETVGITKKLDTLKVTPSEIKERVDRDFTSRIDDMYAAGGKKSAQGEIMGSLYKAIIDEIEPDFPDQHAFIKTAFKDLLCRRLYNYVKTNGLRGDGRETTTVRRIDSQVGLLPRVHGSALFTRGETQTVATATLGDTGMRQKIDKIDGVQEKRFYLQYTFPPSSVGETGRVGAPGRREVGHGNLAERALIPTIPSEADFPYSIRVESLVTESHGSSSMASVCGGCLALMDAGVPIKYPVAGIAMGMLLDDKEGVSDDSAVILSDISGTEDALGTMDFKVAGNREGITTFQLDIKCEGLSLDTMTRALAQAREGRLKILDEMDKTLSASRESLPPTVPKMRIFNIPVDSIGKIIGPGGKQIRAIIEDFKLSNMDVGEDGQIQLSSFDDEQMEKAEEFALALIASAAGGGRGKSKDRPEYAGPEPEVGATYTGKITGIHPFGVFVEIMPGAEDGSTPGLEGLVHVSELAMERVRNCEGFMRSMGVEELTVKYLGKDKNKVQLSRKAVLEEKQGKGPNGSTSAASGRQYSSSNNNGSSNGSSAPPPVPTMSKEEVDVISNAIDGLTDL